MDAAPANVIGPTGSVAARAQTTPAPAPLTAPAYVDPRLETLWAYRSAREDVRALAASEAATPPAPALNVATL